jgi:hypothetical protein
VEAKIRGWEVALRQDGFVTMEDELIRFAGEIIAPQALFFAHNEVGIVAFPRPGKWRGRLELDPLFAKRLFARFEDDPQNHVAEHC